MTFHTHAKRIALSRLGLEFSMTTYAPVTPGATSGLGDDQLFVTNQGYFIYDPVAGVMSQLNDFPILISKRLASFSLATVFGQTTMLQINFYNIVPQIVNYNLTTGVPGEGVLTDPLPSASSAAMNPRVS